MKKLFPIFIIVMLIFGTLGVFAERAYRPIDDEDKPRNLFDFLFATVGGANCDTYPYIYDYTDVGFWWTCPSIRPIPPNEGGPNYGCTIERWDGHYGSPYPRISLLAGEQGYVYAHSTYEMYLCSDLLCNCGDEVDVGCGYKDCPEEQMGRRHSCTPPQCDVGSGVWHADTGDMSYTCVYRSECVWGNGNGNGNGDDYNPEVRFKCKNEQDIYWIDSNDEWAALKKPCEYGCMTSATECRTEDEVDTTVPLIKIISKSIEPVGFQAKGEITLKNIGKSMTTDYIVELQINEEAKIESVLKIPVGQEICKKQNHVHQSFKLAKGSETTLSLVAPHEGAFKGGKVYTAWFVIRKACFDDFVGDLGDCNPSDINCNWVNTLPPAYGGGEGLLLTTNLNFGEEVTECTQPTSTWRAENKCSESRTKKEFKTATDKEIEDSFCQRDANCNPRIGYEVDCVSAETASVDVSQFRGILEGLLGKIFTGTTDPGLCLAIAEDEKTSGDFFEKFAWFTITGDKQQDGALIFGGLVFAMLIILAIFMKN